MKTNKKIRFFIISLVLLFSILIPTTNYQVSAKTISPTHKTTKIKKAVKPKVKKSKKKSTKKKKVATTATSTTTKILSSYTLADVAIHNYATSCWTAISGKVYNLTSWINQHPGGKQAIISLCGKDGTEAFNAQHGGQARPEQELKNFLVGTLK